MYKIDEDILIFLEYNFKDFQCLKIMVLTLLGTYCIIFLVIYYLYNSAEFSVGVKYHYKVTHKGSYQNSLCQIMICHCIYLIWVYGLDKRQMKIHLIKFCSLNMCNKFTAISQYDP